MTINKKICPAGLRNNPNRALKSLDFITIHCTGNYNATASAASHANYQYGGSGGNQTSWHYTVDKDEIWQSFEDLQECWHAGDGSNGPGNYTSIGIEICVNDKAGFKQACANAAWLTVELLKRHNLSVDKVVQHNKWSGKDCPAELRSGAWGMTWDGFITLVKEHLGQPATQVPPADTSGKLYRVQVGAYSVKENADAMLAKVKAAGFTDAYIKFE